MLYPTVLRAPGAISSIAFGKQAELVDGNVIRVLARLRAISGDIKASATTDLFWWALQPLTPSQFSGFEENPSLSHLFGNHRDLAKSLVPETRPGDFNQGLMELGATVCTPQNPACGRCPLQDKCRAYEEVCCAFFHDG